MSSLPSFVELMSSLGLEDGASLSWNPSSSPYLRPRFHSNASSSSDLDDEQESSRQQPAFNTGAYLFVSTDYDQRDRASFMESDIPRVSRHGKGRYCPYSVTSVCSCPLPRPNRRQTDTRVFPLTDPAKGEPSRVVRYEQINEGMHGNKFAARQFIDVNYVINLGTIHFASSFSECSQYSGTEILPNEWEIIQARKRDMVTGDRHSRHHSHLDVFASEISTDITHLGHISPASD